MTKILCIGSITKDIFFPTKEGVILDTPEDLLSQKKIAFELGAKYHITNRAETLGGCSVNVACGLARLGEEVGCLAVIGNDATGKWMKEKLSGYNVIGEEIYEIDEVMSDLSAIIVDDNSGERTIFSSHSASGLLEIQAEKIKDIDWVFVGDLSGDWINNLEKIFTACEKEKIFVAFNPRQKTIAENPEAIVKALEKCALFVVNKDEAVELVSGLGFDISSSQLGDEIFLLNEIKSRTDGLVVITDGLRGAWATDGKNILHVDAIPQDAIDTTGAGDAFTSAFFAAHLKGFTMEICLRWGIANSSSSVTRYGGQEGLLNQDNIIEFAKKVIVN
jgi:ribokinase